MQHSSSSSSSLLTSQQQVWAALFLEILLSELDDVYSLNLNWFTMSLYEDATIFSFPQYMKQSDTISSFTILPQLLEFCSPDSLCHEPPFFQCLPKQILLCKLFLKSTQRMSQKQWNRWHRDWAALRHFPPGLPNKYYPISVSAEQQKVLLRKITRLKMRQPHVQGNAWSQESRAFEGMFQHTDKGIFRSP